jgi:hypothetical protein
VPRSRRAHATRRALSLLLTGVAAFSLAACSAAPEAGDTPTSGEKLADTLVDLFEQKLENPNLSDFERDVFERAVETGRIEPADYEEAFQRYEACMSDLGYVDTWVKGSDGIYQITPPASVVAGDSADVEEYMERGTDCADGTTMRIEAAFAQQQNNPDLLADPRSVAIACLVALGAVPADYTPEDLDREFDGDLDQATFDATDPDQNQCLRGAGFAVALEP